MRYPIFIRISGTHNAFLHIFFVIIILYKITVTQHPQNPTLLSAIRTTAPANEEPNIGMFYIHDENQIILGDYNVLKAPSVEHIICLFYNAIRFTFILFVFSSFFCCVVCMRPLFYPCKLNGRKSRKRFSHFPIFISLNYKLNK